MESILDSQLHFRIPLETSSLLSTTFQPVIALAFIVLRSNLVHYLSSCGQQQLFIQDRIEQSKASAHLRRVDSPVLFNTSVTLHHGKPYEVRGLKVLGALQGCKAHLQSLQG